MAAMHPELSAVAVLLPTVAVRLSAMAPSRQSPRVSAVIVGAVSFSAELAAVADRSKPSGQLSSTALANVPEIEAKVYEGKLHSGNLLMSVHTDNSEERDRAVELLKRLGAQHISTTSEAAVPRAAR